MDAVRVPPSACRTSQSTVTVRSPSLARSTTPRSDRPMSRWISCVRPPIRPLADSRWVRSAVARGSIEYSAVTQPVPLPRKCGGVRSSIVAAHRTSVSPTRMRHEPSAHFWTPRVRLTGRSWSGRRPSARTGDWLPIVIARAPSRRWGRAWVRVCGRAPARARGPAWVPASRLVQLTWRQSRARRAG